MSCKYYNCKGLNDVIVHWQEPISIPTSSTYNYPFYYYPFENTPRENLHIPAGTLSAYKNSYWSFFKNYIEDADNYPIE